MALVLPFAEHVPVVDDAAWLAPTATVIGRARVHARASVFYGAVIRADMAEVVLGRGSNLQDNVVVHTDYGFPALIGAGSLVAGGAVVLEGTRIPPRSLVAGVPGKVRRTLTDEEYDKVVRNAEIYVELAAEHRRVNG